MMMSMTTWLPTKDDQALLYSLICSQLEIDGFTKSSGCLKEEMPGLPTSLVFPGNKLEELVQLCVGIKKHIDSHLIAAQGHETLQPTSTFHSPTVSTSSSFSPVVSASSPFSSTVSSSDPVRMEIKSEPITERSDPPPRDTPTLSLNPNISPECDVTSTDGIGSTTSDEKLVISSTDNDILASPDRGFQGPSSEVRTPDNGLLASDNGLLAPDNGLLAPGDGLLAPGDALQSQLSSVFMSPGPSPTPLKQPGVTPENNPADIALHIQRLIGEEMMKRRLIGGESNSLLLKGLLNSQNRSFLPTPAVRGLSFDMSLLSQNFANHPLLAMVNNLNNPPPPARTTTTTPTAKGTKSTRPPKPGSLCRFCGKIFSQQSALLVHERIHTGEKPYHCHYCDKAFTQISNLKCHERLHTGEKPYRCTECGKRFTQSASLRCHMRSHTGERPYVCKYCNKRFTQPASLQHHIRIHTGEKPYKCEECNKCFTQPSSLVVHRRLHTGERPFVCQICGKSYTQAMPLKEHMKTHHVQEKSPLSFNIGQPFSLQPQEKRFKTAEKEPVKME